MSVRRNGGMADAYGSGPYGSNTVWVQVPSSARQTQVTVPGSFLFSYINYPKPFVLPY